MPNGEIGHTASGPTSGQWRVVGAVTRNNLGGVTRRWSLADILEHPQDISWRHKNGKQKTFLRDCDHGGNREWRSPNHSIF